MTAMGVLTMTAAGVAPALTLAWLSRRLRPLAVALAPLAPLPALVLAIAGADTTVVVPGVFTGLHLGVDPIGRAFLLFTAALWLAAGAYARWYLADDPRRDTFFGFHLLTLSGQLLVVLAQDILTFYLGFAVMTFAAFGLIVHDRTSRARSAGRTYIAMAVAGEAMLLSALLLIGGVAESPAMTAVPDAYAALASPGLVALLVVAGFGIKAGLVPLHVWLPLAHPVAPTPASALLSGAMIKAGLLGWIRFLPLGEIALPALGPVLVGAGVLAAFYGVVAGLAQVDAKTVLAYSSVSQMGYMAVGVGIAMSFPGDAGAALLAVAHYAGHHGAAKAALFLAVGVAPFVLAPVALARRSQPAGSRGPARNRFRRAFFYVGVAAPALALAGAPFTSGSGAKAALKAAGEALGDPWAGWLGLTLSVAAIGTTVLLARFLVVLERGATAKAGSGATGRGLVVAWGAVAALSVAAPYWLPRVYPPPAALVEPVPVLGLADSLWPVTAGLVLALAVWLLRHRWSLRPGAIPPGDLLVPIQQAGGAVMRTTRDRNWASPRPAEWAWRQARPAAVRLSALAGRLDARMGAGAPLGVLLFLLVLALAAAFLAG